MDSDPGSSNEEIEHSAQGAVQAALLDSKMRRADLSEELYEQVCLQACDTFARYKRPATGFHNAQYVVMRTLKSEMGGTMTTKGGGTSKKKSKTNEPLSEYEKKRLAAIRDNKMELVRQNIEPLTGLSTDDVVLWIQKEHLDKIVRGEKTMEIRNTNLVKHLGQRVHLAESESKLVRASVMFTSCEGPYTQAQWEMHMQRHCCGQQRFYKDGKPNFGWGFEDLIVLDKPLGPFYRPPHAQRWGLPPFELLADKH